jgi:hypothetical protein
MFVFDYFVTPFPSNVGVFVSFPVSYLFVISHISPLYTSKNPNKLFPSIDRCH